MKSAGLRDNWASSGRHVLNVDNTTEEYFNFEGNPPYTLADDNSGEFFVTPFDDFIGDWEVWCQAFCDENLGWGDGVDSNGRPNPDSVGRSSEEVSVRFTVVA